MSSLLTLSGIASEIVTVVPPPDGPNVGATAPTSSGSWYSKSSWSLVYCWPFTESSSATDGP